MRGCSFVRLPEWGQTLRELTEVVWADGRRRPRVVSRMPLSAEDLRRDDWQGTWTSVSNAHEATCPVCYRKPESFVRPMNATPEHPRIPCTYSCQCGHEWVVWLQDEANED